MGETKRIECFLDLASAYSFVAFVDLRANLEKLAAHGVEVEFQPVLIGGINALSGNKPPWLHAGKGKYLQLDSRRSSQRVGLDKACSPPDLMSVSHTISPLRALHFIKAHYPLETFLSAIEFLFHQFWSPPHVNLTVDENLRKALLAATGKDGSGRTLFSEDDVQKILDGRVLMKDVLKEQTARAVELGAFGAPWLWVTNAKGETQPFFGSDRFNHIFIFLGIPFQDITVLEPSKAVSRL